MHKAFQEQTGIVTQAGEHLRAGYDVGQLHDLRVAIRRIRSLLKQHGKRRARRWRRIWGSFAGVTGRARDWDVFQEAAANLLAPSQLAEFRTASRDQVQAAHAAVRAMLESPAWQRHLDDWQIYAASGAHRRGQAGGRRSDRQRSRSHSLGPALARANQALSAAFALPDDSGWHPFRIAVKELRYQADRLVNEDTGATDAAAVIATCRELQAHLGGWHDCIVQLHLLDELQAAATSEYPLLNELRGRIEALRRERLAGIHQALEGQSLLRRPNVSR